MTGPMPPLPRPEHLAHLVEAGTNRRWCDGEPYDPPAVKPTERLLFCQVCLTKPVEASAPKKAPLADRIRALDGGDRDDWGQGYRAGLEAAAELVAREVPE